MILYHGSKDPNIIKFMLNNDSKQLDFGTGVYLTTNQGQAEAWAKRKNGAVYVFDVNLEKLSVIKYKDEDLDYVLYLCRIELEDVAKEVIDSFEEADIISGQVLDGNVKNFGRIAEKFNEGDIKYEEYKKHVKLFGDKDQLCFKTQRAIDLLNQSLIRKYRV